MRELESVVAGIAAHPGVEQVLLVGRDGLLVHRAGADGLDAETVAALSPALASACGALADAAEGGEFRTAVLEWDRGVGVLAIVSDELLLVATVRADVGFAPLLRTIRAERVRIAELAG
jgi:predicted regulator of Ras-like GTPase activity (Roadblock/LC7/MglB family)